MKRIVELRDSIYPKGFLPLQKGMRFWLNFSYLFSIFYCFWVSRCGSWFGTWWWIEDNMGEELKEWPQMRGIHEDGVFVLLLILWEEGGGVMLNNVTKWMLVILFIKQLFLNLNDFYWKLNSKVKDFRWIVISRLLLHGVLSVNSPCARFRLMGILVIAPRGYISGLDQNQFTILCLFSH